MCSVNSERIEGGVRQLAAGKTHYTILDNKNKLHVFGSKSIFKEKAEDEQGPERGVQPPHCGPGRNEGRDGDALDQIGGK